MTVLLLLRQAGGVDTTVAVGTGACTGAGTVAATSVSETVAAGQGTMVAAGLGVAAAASSTVAVGTGTVAAAGTAVVPVSDSTVTVGAGTATVSGTAAVAVAESVIAPPPPDIDGPVGGRYDPDGDETSIYGRSARVGVGTGTARASGTWASPRSRSRLDVKCRVGHGRAALAGSRVQTSVTTHVGLAGCDARGTPARPVSEESREMWAARLEQLEALVVVLSGD